MQKRSLNKLLFAGYSPKEYVTFSMKALVGGISGVFAGFLTTFALTSFGLGYAYAAWPGYAIGYFVNIRVQAAVKNFVKKDVPQDK